MDVEEVKETAQRTTSFDGGTPPQPQQEPFLEGVGRAPSHRAQTAYETVAVADFGSNSTRLVLHNVHPDGSFKLVDELREPLRLAEHLDADKRLSPAIVDRTVETARVFMQFCRSQNVTRLVAVATSAIRDAVNRDEVLRRVEQEAGMRLDLLNGEQEAYYGYIGVVNTLNVANGFLLDVGGGSAEIVRVQNRRPKEMISLPFGAIALTRRFLDGNGNPADAVRRLDKALAEAFAEIPWLTDGAPSKEVRPRSGGKKNRTGKDAKDSGRDALDTRDDGPILIGLGGASRNIGKMYKRRCETPLDLLHGITVPITELYAINDTLRGMTNDERMDVPGLSPVRADIIVGGMATICGLAKAIGASKFRVSGRGLRDGLFFSLLLPNARPRFPMEDPAVFATRNLMRYYGVPEEHARHVVDLALSLFDQLAPLHGLGIPERRLLQIAALLHDVGIAVSYYNHGAHGFYLLTHTGVDGLTHRELVMVAHLVAFHAGEGSPFKRWPEYSALLEEEDVETVHQLGTLLRVAEALDRSESGNVPSVKVAISWDGAGITLRPTVRGQGGFEMRSVEPLLANVAQAFSVKVTLEPER